MCVLSNGDFPTPGSGCPTGTQAQVSITGAGAQVEWRNLEWREPFDMYGGAAVAVQSGAQATFIDVRFNASRLCGQVGSNHDGGGAVHASGGSNLTFRGCSFVNNEASSGWSQKDGGAVYVSGGEARFESCNFTDNWAFSYGGSIAAVGGAEVALVGCLFSHNSASGSERYPPHAGTNRYEGRGGALYVSGSSTEASLERCEFYNNDAALGAAICASDSGIVRLVGALNSLTPTSPEVATRNNGQVLAVAPPPSPPSYSALADATIYGAVDDWLAGGSDRSSAEALYGPIGQWDVSQVRRVCCSALTMVRVAGARAMVGARGARCASSGPSSVAKLRPLSHIPFHRACGRPVERRCHGGLGQARAHALRSCECGWHMCARASCLAALAFVCSRVQASADEAF